MAPSGYINLADKDRNRSIFRVFSWLRLQEVFQQKQLTLVRPKLWDDPFENYIMNATGHLTNGAKFRVGFRDHFYAQCWSFRKESDALWRIYAPGKDGVKVRTTVERLFNALYAAGGVFRDISCWIGRVTYHRSASLKSLLKNGGAVSAWILDPSGKGQAQTLCFKRIQFDYEREVRLIFNSQGKAKSDIHKVTIDPSNLFDEIVFDPRMTRSDFQSRKSTLVKLGFSKKIIQSSLYDIPKLSFTLHP